MSAEEVAALRTRLAAVEAERDAARAALQQIASAYYWADSPAGTTAREALALTPKLLERERDTAQREIAALRTRLAAVEAERDALRDQRDASFEEVAALSGDLERATARAEQAERELAVGDLLKEVAALSGDLERATARAEAAEAEVARLRGAQLSSALAAGEAVRAIMQTRAEALREAADIAREHGGISAYYAIRKLAAKVEP